MKHIAAKPNWIITVATDPETQWTYCNMLYEEACDKAERWVENRYVDLDWDIKLETGLTTKSSPIVTKSELMERQVLADAYMRELFLSMLWTTEDEGQFAEGDHAIALAYIEKTWPSIEIVNQKLKEVNYADVLGYPVLKDRHSELLWLGQGDMGRQDCMDGESSRDPGEPGWSSRLANPISESCPCITCRGEREENKPYNGTGCDC